MKKVKLTQGKYAIVDDEDYDYLMQWKWHFGQGRAKRIIWTFTKNGIRKANTIFMHRVINNTPAGLDTDHINQDPLDNRRNNLRTLEHWQNLHNRTKQKNNKSGYKGIYQDSFTRDWRAEISISGKKIALGRFKNLKAAIKARAMAEIPITQLLKTDYEY